jgi:hypothetical protein
MLNTLAATEFRQFLARYNTFKNSLWLTLVDPSQLLARNDTFTNQLRDEGHWPG